MAGKVVTRQWTSRGPRGRRVKHVAYGYDVTINGKRERRFSGEHRAGVGAHRPIERPYNALRNKERGTPRSTPPRRCLRRSAGTTAERRGASRASLQAEGWRGVGEGTHGVRDRCQAGRADGIPVPRPQTHGGQPHGDARRHAEGSAGDPRAQDVLDDVAVQPSQPGTPPRGGEPPRRPHGTGADGT